MAYGSYAGMDGVVPGFRASDEGTASLGEIAGSKYGTQAALTGNVLASTAQMRAQKYLADKQLEAAQVQADAMNSPMQLIGGALGLGGSLLGAAGKAGSFSKLFS
jgi:hypothetical protein